MVFKKCFVAEIIAIKPSAVGFGAQVEARQGALRQRGGVRHCTVLHCRGAQLTYLFLYVNKLIDTACGSPEQRIDFGL